MARSLHIQFDPNQDYQIEAVESVIRLLEGLPNRSLAFTMSEEIVSNGDDLGESLLRDNLRAVQEQNHIPQSMPGVEYDDGMMLPGVSHDSHRYPSFTIEMETGTGKTYVYLRTIYELRKRYGFSKFIIVVPSIAIYEGVVKNFQITRDHFRALYGNETVALTRYDGSQVNRLRAFATSTFTEIMVITLDAFNKGTNNIYKPSERLPGERLPYQFIQETRPILILDEPQTMESDRAKEALRTLRPLFALRYSATHRSSPNLVYRLTPFDAYRRNLVKRIQVYGITERDNFNQPFLLLQSISRPPTITARVKTYVTEKGRTREAELTLKHGDDLFARTGRDEHRGCVVAEINAGEGFVQFQNGIRISGNETIGPARETIFRTQIEKTIEQHLETQDRLYDQGIKVLSLFFIDRVANYTEEQGIVRRLFDQAFDRLKARSAHFANLHPEQVREAYFAKTRTRSGEERAIDTQSRTASERAAEKAAFELIMRKKEQLLSFDEKVCFIFAHSALREGWDNPNVFQICTLNQTVSEIKKRQEIGRGLRLCVNQQGQRVFGDEVNLLTVVANESYSSYASRLQQEYAEDGEAAPPPPTDASKRWAIRNDAIFFGEPAFREFWEKLSRRAAYRVNIDTDELIARCIERLDAQTFPDPALVVEKGEVVFSHDTDRPRHRPQERARLSPQAGYPVFNLLDRAVRETDLTRPTINRIFKGMRPARKAMLLKNPEGFARVFIAEIKNALADHIAERVEFVVGDITSAYDLDDLFPPKQRSPQKELIAAGSRSLYDHVQCDSKGEEKFIGRLREDDKVIFYFKFPSSFMLQLPRLIGNYRPGWGIARYDDAGNAVLHLIRETRGATDLKRPLFPHERRKILCAGRYFAALKISYRLVSADTPQWWRDEDEA